MKIKNGQWETPLSKMIVDEVFLKIRYNYELKEIIFELVDYRFLHAIRVELGFVGNYEKFENVQQITLVQNFLKNELAEIVQTMAKKN